MSATDDLSDVVVGYPKLAAKIEILPEIAIFRRFGALNAQNLLYYQAELTYLERKLKLQQSKDSQYGNGNERSYAVDWFWLENSKVQESAPQLDLILRIRKVLKEYSKLFSSKSLLCMLMVLDDFLVQQSTILQYAEPGDWDLHHIQNYLQLPEMGQCALEGPDSVIWGSVADRKSHKPDLITLRPRAREDPFSKWAAENTIFNLFKCGCARFIKPSRKHGVISYKDSTIYKITYWITVILAALIPIASIAVLNEVQSMPARLAIIAAFNVLISICLIGFADAKRDQVFAINAAYVYFAQNLSCNCTHNLQLCRRASSFRWSRQMPNIVVAFVVESRGPMETNQFFLLGQILHVVISTEPPLYVLWKYRQCTISI
jgi:hypothetical protein